MTSSQSDRLDMYDATVEYVETTNAISSTRAGLMAGKNSLKTTVADIKAKAAKQGRQTGGITDDKAVLKETLALKMFAVTSGTAGYAASINNNTLKEEMNYSISELRRLKDDTIETVVANISTIVTPVLGAGLTGFGVDAAAMTAMTTAKDDYLLAKNKPREASVVKSAQTDALVPLYVEATRICRDIMDKAAATLNATQADWYSAYQNVRKIVNTASRHTTVEGDCLEMVTNTPIYNATVTLTRTGETDIIAHADINGHWKVIPIKHGVWALKATHPDYNDVTMAAFEIKLGQSVIKSIIMERK
ncbi:MAG: hypothetical protein ABI723_18685 [Bacteroidia bacterium]